MSKKLCDLIVVSQTGCSAGSYYAFGVDTLDAGFGIFGAIPIFDDDVKGSLLLGVYDTEERAKEVLKEIVAAVHTNDVFTMPSE